MKAMKRGGTPQARNLLNSVRKTNALDDQTGSYDSKHAEMTLAWNTVIASRITKTSKTLF